MTPELPSQTEIDEVFVQILGYLDSHVREPARSKMLLELTSPPSPSNDLRLAIVFIYNMGMSDAYAELGLCTRCGKLMPLDSERNRCPECAAEWESIWKEGGSS